MRDLIRDIVLRMPKINIAMRSIFLTCLISCFLSVTTTARGQEVSKPPDAKELMLAAAKTNNLTAEGVKPWHLKASFQLFDEQGAVMQEGTIEEWWAAPKRFKVVFQGKAFAETEFGSEKGQFETGVEGILPARLLTATGALLNPLPNQTAIEHSTYALKSMALGSLEANCISEAENPFASTYCLASGEPTLRVMSRRTPANQFVYSRILHYDGHTVGGSLKVSQVGNAQAAINVDILEPLENPDEAFFAVPSDAVPIPKRVAISGGVAVGLLDEKVAPEYPRAAKDTRTEGAVVLEAIIGKDGRIRDLKAVSGPQIFQGAAIAAVQQWRYRPYLLNGEPVEVQTTINVVFTLNH